MKPSTRYALLRGPSPVPESSESAIQAAVESEIIGHLIKSGAIPHPLSGQALVDAVDRPDFLTTAKEIISKYDTQGTTPTSIISTRVILRERGRSLIAQDIEFVAKCRRKLFCTIGASLIVCSLAGGLIFYTRSTPAPQPHPVQSSAPSSIPTAPIAQKQNILEAWLSFSCPHCKQAWTFLQEIRADKTLPEDVPIKFRFIASRKLTDQTLALYYEALQLQSNDLALAFCDWVFENQTRLLKNGIQSDDLKWLQQDQRFNYARFNQDVISKEIAIGMQQNVVDFRKHKLSSTPTIVLRGAILSGSNITKENVLAALRN